MMQKDEKDVHKKLDGTNYRRKNYYSQKTLVILITPTGGTFRYKKLNLNKRRYSVFEILQLRVKFQTAMVWCSIFIWITNSSDHRRV